MKPKILFFEPGVKITKFPPIGIAVLAGFMRGEGYPVAVHDFSGREIESREIRAIMIKEDPKYVGIRVLTGPHIPRALKISKIAKQMGKKVIWGGPHPTILPEQTLRHPLIDAVVIGEGENALVDLINYLEGKKVKPLGCGIKKKNKISIFEQQKKFVDTEKIPMPAWDLFKNLNEYFPSKDNNILPVISSRGCPFKCAFCHNANVNVRKYLGPYRVTSAKRIIDEYEFIQSKIKNKIGMINADSDYHLVSKDYLRNWCETMKKRAPNIKWGTCGRYSSMDLEMVEMLKKSNCVEINLGVESGSKRIQEFNCKVIDLKKAMIIGRALTKSKIFLINTYILGHPTETLDDLKQTMRYIKKIPASSNIVQIYRPIPGTPYYELSLRESKIKPFNKLEDWGTQGTLRDNINVSRIPDRTLFRYFFLINLVEQWKELYNRQKYNLRNRFYRDFWYTFVSNRFIKKLREILESYGL